MTFPVNGDPRIRQIAGFDGARTRDGNDTQRIQWLVNGVTTPEEAEDEMIAAGKPPSEIDFTPPVGDTKTIKLQKYSWEEAVDGNEKAYVFTGEYSFEKLDTDEWTFSVTTSGGSIRVTNSFATSSFAAPSATAPDFDNAIEVRDGKPQGIDRIIPAIRYTLTYRLERPIDIVAYAETAASITGTTNDAEYFGSQAGELLFLGMDGNFGNQINPELQFSWAKSKNATISIGDIASVAKKGHDYVWVLYEDEDTGTGADAYVIQKPRAAYVERIYDQADHSVLGLTLE